MLVDQNEKRGIYISELRKACGMTQRELAEQLNVTDKAVSKWERGISCPDVGLILPLAEILHVSASSLLNGEREEESETAKDEHIVEKALRYAGHSVSFRIKNIRKYIVIFVTCTAFIAMCVCLISDICINQKLTWSWITSASLIFAWLLTMTLCKAKQDVMIRSLLIMLSLCIMPYLYILRMVLAQPLILSLGICISIIALIGLWSIYVINCRWNQRRFLASALSLLVLLPVTLGINHSVTLFMESYQVDLLNDIINTASILGLALLCFVLDMISRNKSAQQ